MRHWEMDFGQLGERFEFLVVVDRGTSILVDTQTQPHYKAESALMAVARLLIRDGRPEKLRFDNDPPFVGNWLADGFPSPLMRFLLCLGVEPDLVEPGKPYHKPFAERTIRTLKYESLAHIPPPDYLAAADRLTDYRSFFNHERAHQGLACGNRPPFEAFPTLPSLPHVPQQVDPDAWLAPYHLQVFGRRVGRNGMLAVGRHNYYVGYAHAGARVSVILDAKGCVFRIVYRGTVICEKEIQGLVGRPLPFQDYLTRMLLEARTTDPR